MLLVSLRVRQNIKGLVIFLGKAEVFHLVHESSGDLEIYVSPLRAFGSLWSLFPWTLHRERGFPVLRSMPHNIVSIA